MPAELAVAMIGLGGKGRSHAANLARLPGVRLVALCDLEEAMIERPRTQLGERAAKAPTARPTPTASSATGNVDAVVISTQHDTHAPLTIAAAGRRSTSCARSRWR